jgi:hypothetical protein
MTIDQKIHDFLQREHESAVTRWWDARYAEVVDRLTAIHEAASPEEQARIIALDDQFHKDVREGLVTWARTVVPDAFAGVPPVLDGARASVEIELLRELAEHFGVRDGDISVNDEDDWYEGGHFHVERAEPTADGKVKVVLNQHGSIKTWLENGEYSELVELLGRELTDDEMTRLEAYHDMDNEKLPGFDDCYWSGDDWLWTQIHELVIEPGDFAAIETFVTEEHARTVALILECWGDPSEIAKDLALYLKDPEAIVPTVG